MDKNPLDKKTLIIVTGPTAVGKTSASVTLAKAVGGEIISADSMQVYKHMDIGTAKITPDEMEGVPHHMIDRITPDTPFHVYEFKKMAQACVDDICGRGRIPIFAGGTGFYIQALLYDVDFCEEEEEGHAYRTELERLAGERGVAYLHDLLRQADADSAEAIHPNNVKRVIRALEYIHNTGVPISVHNREQRKKTSPYEFLYFVLTMDRQKLYERINRRVDLMFEQGLVDEFRRLLEHGCTKDMISMQAIGYKELFPYVEGEISLEEAKEQIKKDSRHFAKRQLTWFRREREVIFLDKDDYESEDELVKDMMYRAERKKLI